MDSRESWQNRCDEIKDTMDVEELKGILMSDEPWPVRFMALIYLPLSEQETFTRVKNEDKDFALRWAAARNICESTTTEIFFKLLEKRTREFNELLIKEEEQ